MNAWSIIKSLIYALFTLLKTLLVFVLPFVFAFLVLIIIFFSFYFYFRFVKGMKPSVPDVLPSKKTSFWKNLFYLFPRRLTLDMLERDNNAFGKYGIHMVTGAQGSGKTITVVYLLQEWKKRYPRMEVNMCYKYEDGELEHWQDLLEHNNGIYGVVNVIDECQVWFSNKESKELPPEMLGEISQQRKQRKATIGTVQVFNRLAKPFREQTHFVYIPYTFFGCLTVVRISKSKYYDANKDTFRRYCGMFMFAHTKELREAYDTYKKIEKYKDMEFSENTSLFVSASSEAPSLTETEAPPNA